ncbi:MAG: putative hydroxymethylpyrimidine transporter CytX [Desulfocurvibacter africanus]
MANTVEGKSPGYSGIGLFLLWFGAAVSVAELLTGGYLADLGLVKGMWANVVGHLIGTALLVLAGLMGYRQRLPAIMSFRRSLGRQGSWLVSLLNVLQLVGWTAVMVQQGGQAVDALLRHLWGVGDVALATCGLGLLVGLWAVAEAWGVRILNMVAVVLLFGLTLVLGTVVLGQPVGAGAAKAEATFGLGLELAVIMPLSWFPLIADYTSRARSATAAWLAPFLGYFLGSTAMYAMGLFGALTTGSADPTGMLLAAGLGVTALLVMSLSTVTTTFMDVYSAAVSWQNVFPKASRRVVSVAATLIGTLLAVTLSSELYMAFLFLIGSVFAPLAAVVLTDYWLLREDRREQSWDPAAWVSLAGGFAFHRLAGGLDLPMGATLGCIIFTAILHLIVRKLLEPAARRAITGSTAHAER